MLLLEFTPVEKNRCWTVTNEGAKIAEVRVTPEARCVLQAFRPLDLGEVDSIAVFMDHTQPKS